MTPDVCPVCGAVVPEKAKACPECGSDDETGWSDEGRADSLGLPSGEFDYDDYVKSEFEGEKPKRKFGVVWVVTAIVLLILLAMSFL